MITVTSSAFESGQAIPRKYTGDGADLSPPLAWSNLPPQTRELALICDDPDAPTRQPWSHWVLYKIPPTTSALPEGVEKTARPPQLPGALQGSNSWGKIGYGGPAPPRGHGTHHYHFRVYALDSPLPDREGMNRQQLLDAMKGHVLAQGELVGTYAR
ncbi:MAG: YbhB/YbcL family Raf kinase inhibitor-like protein [Phycisphaerae bacterium]